MVWYGLSDEVMTHWSFCHSNLQYKSLGTSWMGVFWSELLVIAFRKYITSHGLIGHLICHFKGHFKSLGTSWMGTFWSGGKVFVVSFRKYVKWESRLWTPETHRQSGNLKVSTTYKHGLFVLEIYIRLPKQYIFRWISRPSQFCHSLFVTGGERLPHSSSATHINFPQGDPLSLGMWLLWLKLSILQKFMLQPFLSWI